MAAPQGLSEKKVEAAMRFPQKCIKACACAHHSAVRCGFSAVAIAQLIIGEPVIANPPVCTKSNDKAYLPLDRTFALLCGTPHSARTQELFCKDTRKLVEMFNTDTIKESDP